MGKNYAYDANGVGIKDVYTSEIRGQQEIVVVVVYKSKPGYEHHFYRRGGETGCAVEYVPGFFRPNLGTALGKLGRSRAGSELQKQLPVTAKKEVYIKREVVVYIDTFRTNRKPGDSGQDRATKIFE